MNARHIIVLILLAVAMSLVLTLAISDEAYAQTEDGTADKTHDKKQASKRGVGDSLAEGRETEGEGPTRVQMALGIGSFIVMIIVVKWL